MKVKFSAVQAVRHTIQILAFILFPGLFLSVFNAARDIFTAIVAGNFSFQGYAGRVALLASVIAVTVVFGRFFCGYLCSFGAMGDLFSYISKKTLKRGINVSTKVDRALKWLKYAVLSAIVICIWALGLKDGAGKSPWDVFGMYSTPAGWTNLSGWLTMGGILLIAIMAGSFFIERFFCRYLCPLGAALDAVSAFRLLRIKKPKHDCGKCTVCTGACPMGIALYEQDDVKSGECINCFKCTDACPRKNATVTTVPAIAGAAAALSIPGLYYAGTLAAPAPAQIATDAETAPTQSAVELQYEGTIYEDGVHTGTGSGFRGETKAEVTVENGMITEIKIVSSGDDAPYLNSAINGVIPQIIGGQSPDVSAVSGATFSSNGIMEAVANALNIEGFETQEPVRDGKGGHGAHNARRSTI